MRKQTISLFVVKQIKEYIPSSFFERYILFLGTQEERFFYDYISSWIKKECLPFASEQGFIKKTHTSFIKKRQNNKRNWVIQLNKERNKDVLHPIKKEFLMNQKLLNEWKHHLPSTTETIEIDLDIYTNRIMKEMEEWRKNKDCLLSSYRYLENKKSFQIEAAFDLDFQIFILEAILTKYKGDLSFKIEHHPYTVDNHPIFSPVPTRATFMKKEEQDDNYVEDYIVDQYFTFRTLVRLDSNESVKIKMKYRHLDEKDARILNVLLSSITDDFYRERIITVPMIQLVESVYESKSKNNYLNLEKRLHELKKYEYKVFIYSNKQKKPSTVSFNLLNTVVTDFDDKGQQYVKVFVGDAIYHDIINRQTVMVYQEFIEKLENPLSKLLIYSLQKERIQAYMNKTYEQTYPYTFFSRKIRFHYSDPISILKEIETALKEFSANHIIVQDFTIDTQLFIVHITYIPLNEEEIYDVSNYYQPKQIESTEHQLSSFTDTIR